MAVDVVLPRLNSYKFRLLTSIQVFLYYSSEIYQLEDTYHLLNQPQSRQCHKRYVNHIYKEVIVEKTQTLINPKNSYVFS